jgi:hypothetical protein
MDLIAVGEGVGAQLARRARLEVDVLRGAQGLQNGIKTLPRPGEPLAQLMDGDAIGMRGKTLIGRLELLPEAMGLDEPGALLVVIKPGTQGFPERGVARGGALPRCGLPIEHAIEALEEVGRQANTDDPPWSWACVGMDTPITQKTLQNVVHWQILEGKTGTAKRGFFPALSSRLKFPLVARMSDLPRFW